MELVDVGKPKGPTALLDPPKAGLVVENEPNDDRDHAQPIDADKGIRGQLTGTGTNKDQDDWYSYLVQGGDDTGKPQEVRFTLQGGPSADLRMDILDGEGRTLVSLDDKKGGEPEIAHGLVFPLGQTVYVRVRPSARASGRAEWPGADGVYHLTLSQNVAPAGSETEPNDTQEQATQAPQAQGDLTGILSHKKDEDWFAVPLPENPAEGASPGILRIEVHTPLVEPVLRILAEGAPGGSPKTQLAELRAGKNTEDLLIRNLGLPKGTKTVFLGLRAGSAVAAPRQAEAKDDRRYLLKVALSPPLEGAEQEPNDRCTDQPVFPAAPHGMQVAGFLWPADVDCYKLHFVSPTQVAIRLDLPPSCQAELVLTGQSSATTQSGQRALEQVAQVAAGSDLLVQIRHKGPKACFAEPYKLDAVYTEGAP